MFNAEYINTNSLLSRFDPRLKIVFLFLFSVALAVFKSFPALFSALFISVVVLFFASVPLKQILRRLLPVNAMVLFLWFFLPFTTPGDVIWTVSIFKVTQAGLLLASTLTVKANAMMLMFIAFVVSTPVNTAGHAMSRLGMPDKLVHLFFFTYRYIHVIYDEYLRLKKAMLIRGFVPGTNIHTYRSYAYLVGMLLVKSADRAKRVHNAMLCRGFHGKFYSLAGFSITKADIAVFIFMLLLIVLMGVVEWVPDIRLLNLKI